ncbi:hypothetical protein GQX73_g5169 [Xylaria multiplex]|uniref:NACHT-NTPase and P-loop NTPases N-terminal domain-containing protein n=1 Tax=Xylaria multiplex TaxID=323545 RepID=A0A7C8N4Y8_9PEZI|nr:hypothetical protein GQX73_g5169 [Xylaria multiplex]
MSSPCDIVSGAIPIIEQSITLLNHIGTGVDTVKGLPEAIGKHINDLKSIGDILDLIKRDEALQTLEVGAAAKDVQDAGIKLMAHLQLMQTQSRAGKAEQVVRGFFGASKDEYQVESIMEELRGAKLSLIAYMSVVNVGIAQGANKALQINNDILDKMENLLREKLGDDTKSLKLVDRVEGQVTDEDEFPNLSPDNVKSPQENTVGPAPMVMSRRPKRVVSGNLVRDSARMPFPATGNDWGDSDVFVVGNVAGGNSVMQNAPLPASVLLEMFKRRATSNAGRNVDT